MARAETSTSDPLAEGGNWTKGGAWDWPLPPRAIRRSPGYNPWPNDDPLGNTLWQRVHWAEKRGLITAKEARDHFRLESDIITGRVESEFVRQAIAEQPKA